ncbi:hypothetical protein UFOVP1326_6 [uncultured Caudovirales phage]|uniref:Uncharacterized protein n=1 Tax=uncultured Caudovirales phage TaxID=2100421 RepID=A0A6J5SFQ9_9CAUD|nr:hypothetical protein UFOVP1326_6 [uncultured Caudovirales phage]CAB4212764.1 hypothetical protein UFOVP1436_33 [uncultured Caudovirales phage]
MNIEQLLLAAIYPAMILLLGVTLWRLVAAWIMLNTKGWFRSRTLVTGAIIITATLLLEQVWYGTGRFFPGLYGKMSTFAPVVGLFKLMYVTALLVWTRAYFELTEDPPAWRCALGLSLLVVLASLLLAVGIN